MNIDNITPAQTKAIENGGTNNAVIGGSLVKRGIMVAQADMSRAIIPFKFVLSAEYATATETAALIEDAPADADFAAAMQKEEDATPTSEDFEIAQENRRIADEKDAEIERLRAEYDDADDDRREEIRIQLFHFGTVVYPEGSTEHAEYAAKLRAALAQWTGTEEAPAQSDADVKLAEAIDADDTQAKVEILAAIDRDAAEKRFSKIERWTDENLDIKEHILRNRLARRTLRGSDRMQAIRHLDIVTQEMKSRGLIES